MSVFAEQQNQFQSLLKQADLAYHAGVVDAAIALWQKALDLQEDVWPHWQMALAYDEQNDYQQALKHYLYTLNYAPNDVDVLMHIANLQHRHSELAQAHWHYKQVITLEPLNTLAHNHLANVLITERRYQEARLHVQMCLRLAKDDVNSHINAGLLAFAEENHEQALSAFEAALALDPEAINIQLNIGATYKSLSDFAKAQKIYEQALLKAPEHPLLHYNLALTLLARGEYANGFKEFEWRWQCPISHKYKRDFSAPVWHGEDLSDKTLFIVTEQGLGDYVQFARFIPLLKQRFATATIVAQIPNPLLALLGNLDGLDFALADNKAPAEFDYYISILSLAERLYQDEQDLDTKTPYVLVEPMLLNHWEQKLTELAAEHIDKTWIGLVWAGNPEHENDAKRSAKLATFNTLFQRQDSLIVILQKEINAQDLKFLRQQENVLVLSDELTSFAVTAAIVQHLDLVITVDTALAHVSAALGQSTWLMLPKIADWRWQIDKADSLWYPSVTLFRQKKHYRWDDVLVEINTQLDKLSYIPNEADSLFQQAKAAQKQGHDQLAEQLYQDILAKQPEHIGALHMLGMLMFQHQQAKQGLQLLTQARQLDPDNALLNANMGLVYTELGNYIKAEKRLDDALRLAPDRADSLANMANLYYVQYAYEKAVELYNQALKQDAKHYTSLNGLGICHEKLGKPEVALKYHLKALALNFDTAKTHNNLGNIHKQLGQAKQSLHHYQQAVELDKKNQEYQFNLAQSYLWQQEFNLGWQYYEARLSILNNELDRAAYPYPYWQDQNISNKNLLVIAEQGLGEHIMFLPLLSPLDKQANIHVEIDPRLLPLVSKAYPNIKFYAQRETLNQELLNLAIDFQINMGSLPGKLNLTADPRSFGRDLLTPEQKQVNTISSGILKPQQLNIGFSWRAGAPRKDFYRTIPLEYWLPLFQTPQTNFINLQYGAVSDELKILKQQNHINLNIDKQLDPMQDLDYFAALISQLDLVITADNTTLHMAGALGKTCWALLPLGCDWRFGIDQSNMLWYDSVRLFRQDEERDWQVVMTKVKHEVEKLLEAKQENG